MADPQAPLLTLESLVESLFIRVGTQTYDVRGPGDLSLRQSLWLERKLIRFFELSHRFAHDEDGVTDADEVEMNDLGNRILAIALVAPAEVRDALPPGYKLRIIRAFLRLPRESSTPAAAEAAPAAGPSTGETSSPDSNGSTAEAPSNGSSASRLH